MSFKSLHLGHDFAWTVTDTEDPSLPIQIDFSHGEHGRQLLGTLRLTEADAMMLTEHIRTVVFARRSTRR